MYSEPLISVIVPVYKVEKYLRSCIDSIVSQSYHSLEILLIDDGSPDSCGKICDEYAKKDERINVIHKDNGGLSDARNRGLDCCRGEFISFIDSDDVVSEYFIETLYKAHLKSHSDIVSTAYNFPRFKDDDEECLSFPDEIDLSSLKTFSVREALEQLLYQVIPSGVTFRLYRRAVFEQLRFPRGWVFEDLATVHAAFMNSNSISVINAPIYAYRQRSDSIIRMKNYHTKMVVVSVTEQLYRDIMSFDENLYNAVCSRIFAQYYHVFLQIPFSDIDNINIIWKEMKKYHKAVLKDKNHYVRKKNKIGAFLVLFGKIPSYYFGRLYLRIR